MLLSWGTYTHNSLISGLLNLNEFELTKLYSIVRNYCTSTTGGTGGEMRSCAKNLPHFVYF